MSWTQPAYASVAQLVNGRTGLALANREGSVEAGIRRAMARASVRDVADYLELIRRDDNALDVLIDELTIGETYFFREPAHFQFIQRVILPELRCRQQRDAGRPLRFWSAA